MTQRERSVTVKRARELVLNSVKPLPPEKIPILGAAGRVLSEDIISVFNIPPFDNSAMDGYAVIAADTARASRENPIRLKIIDEIRAGDNRIVKRVEEGTAIRIMTGAPMPDGADAVIQFEDTHDDGDALIMRPVERGENIRLSGEDILRGSTVLSSGDRLKSSDVGLLASLNIESVLVYSRPRVAIIQTGDEIVRVGEEMKPGQIRNSNVYTLFSEIEKYEGLPENLGIARDTPDAIKEKLLQAVGFDVIITTGGVSMGVYDYIKDAISDLGIDIVFEKIKMKPGRPCVFGTKNNTLFFGLPGNPVSAMVTFMQFVRPALLRIMGARRIEKPMINAILEEDIKKKPDREHFIRGYFSIRDGVVFVNTTGPQGSGILRSMSMANCLIILPIGVASVKAGDTITIQLINHEEI